MPEADKKFSYWGVSHIGGGKQGSDAPAIDLSKPEAGGQVLASQAGGVSREQGWFAIEYLIEQILPTAERAGVRLAIHPQDPAYPPEGLNGVHHVVGSVEGMRRLMDLAPESPSLGLNFCQGTVAEMATEPNATVLAAIHEFGAAQADLHGALPQYHRRLPGFPRMLPRRGCARHAGLPARLPRRRLRRHPLPRPRALSDLDVGRERFFAYALGYTQALLKAL